MEIPSPDPNAQAAHELLAELRTRIATQPLPYQYGAESRALGSLREVFDQARGAIHRHPGCEIFAARATDMLNRVIRPFTAKWHRAHEAGELNGRDGSDEFRGDLQQVQAELRTFARELQAMAYGHTVEDALTPEVMEATDIEALFHPIPFGFRTADPRLAEVAARMNADEADAVARRRAARQVSTPPGVDAIGLAFSGGGIRSATFCLGVAQVLAEKQLLREVDFLSTVSGGGYTGSFLSRNLGQGESLSGVAAPGGPDPDPVRYVRQNARFLAGNNLVERWSMVCATLAGMLLNWSAPALVIVLLALFGVWVGEGWVAVRGHVLGAASIGSVVAMVFYGWAMRRGKRTSSIAGRLLTGTVAITGIVGLGMLVDTFLGEPLRNALRAPTWPGGLGLLTGGIAMGAPAFARFMPVLRNPKARQWVLKVSTVLVSFFVPFAAILLFYVLLDVGRIHRDGLLIAAVVLGFVSLFVVNINLTAPHRLYRDCLARTFIQKSADGSPIAPLKDLNPSGTAPYHLLNAALNLPRSETAALKDRGCDFFLFSKEWIGSASTGYQRTREWQANGTDVDLGTAMAVSGAAFSTHMGLASKPALTALLTLLNVRLGFWIRNPLVAGGSSNPGFLCLLRETLGLGMTERSSWLNLSDGGHIENLAVYELLRRRCKFIVCVDGEADPQFTFHGFMTLVRHARIDFGVSISPVLDEIRPDAQTGCSRSHFHLCRVHYPEGTGLLLYLKLSVTGNESELIRRYRTNNPEFPHQSTLDQFFDQEQFEAYRQLGVHVAEGLFKPALLDGTQPDSVPCWFRKLAKNLLEPGGA